MSTITDAYSGGLTSPSSDTVAATSKGLLDSIAGLERVRRRTQIQTEAKTTTAIPEAMRTPMITPTRCDWRPLTGVVDDVVEEAGGDSEMVFV